MVQLNPFDNQVPVPSRPETRWEANLEAERASIAAEIHDGLLPYLFATAAKISSLRAVVAREAETRQASSAAESSELLAHLQAGLADAARWVDESREVARQLMNGMSFPPLAVSDPLQAAAVFLEDVLDLASMPDPPIIRWLWCDRPESCKSVPSPSAGVFAPETAIALYRLTIEAVRNAVRHSGATRINISADYGHGSMRVRLEDNGCGFDPAAVASDPLHGLALSRQRASAAGIDWKLESSGEAGSALKTGTRITLKVQA